MRQVIIVLVCLVALAACRATPSELTGTTPSPATAAATEVQPGSESPPETIFAAVGSTAELSGQAGIKGKAVVAGLQTLIIVGFSYDGKAPADLRLVNAADPDQPAHILLKLDKAYDAETLQFTIPAELTPGTADSVAVYDTAGKRVLASAKFQ